MQVVGEHIPALGFVTNNLMYAKGSYPNINLA